MLEQTEGAFGCAPPSRPAGTFPDVPGHGACLLTLFLMLVLRYPYLTYITHPIGKWGVLRRCSLSHPVGHTSVVLPHPWTPHGSG